MKVLVIRFSSLGDIILTLPVLETIRRHWPESQTDYLTKGTFASLLHDDPRVRRLWTLTPDRPLEDLIGDLRGESYNLVIDLHATARSRWVAARLGRPTVRVDKAGWARRWLVWTHSALPNLSRHTVDRYLDTIRAQLGLRFEPERVPRLQLDGTERQFAEDWLKPSSGQRRIAIHPLAQHATKQWPAERFIEVANRLGAEGWVVHWIGSPAERDLLERFRKATRTPSFSLADIGHLRRLGAVLARMDVALTGDSGPMHLAVAAGCPVVAIFGSTHPLLGFSPLGPCDKVVGMEELNCRPCHLHGRPACPKGHFRCMNDIGTDRVMDTLKGLARG